MDTREFFGRTWSPDGWHCLVLAQANKSMRHYWYDSIDVATAAVQVFARKGETVYHGCANYIAKGTAAGGRKGQAVSSVDSIWLDMDVGSEPTKYQDKSAALVALKSLLTRYKLPLPLVLDSGGGLHAYFTFGESIEAPVALPVMKMLKLLAQREGVKIDPTRTADIASILRPIGSINYKYQPPRNVDVLFPSEDCSFDDLAAALSASGVEIPAEREPRSTGDSPNQLFMPFVKVEADAFQIANKCRQMALIRDTKGNVPEPLWYGGIELLYHCKNGEEVTHEWSKGHPQYSEQETNAKIDQIKNLGPTTCQTFEGRNPAGCVSCPYRGKITSPIQLGTDRQEITEAPRDDVTPAGEELSPALEADVFIHPPRPFKRTASGIVMLNEDGIETLIYPYDLYLHEIAYDPIEQHEIATIRHWLPQEGWKEFSFRSAEVASEKDFEKAMRDNHVKPLSSKFMRLYLTMYMSIVQHAKRMRLLHASMGWKNGTASFVLGNKELTADGREINVGIAASIASTVKGIHSKGQLENWSAATGIFDLPDMEAHGFLFGCGAAAPLMKFTGYECALVNAVGASNSGKTSMARFFMSMYGEFDSLKLRQRDTANAKIARLGLMGSLPMYIDEITNTDAQELSDLVYEFTQGRSKLRLRVDGTEREVYLWNTVVVSSSNSALLGKLGAVKSNPEAERLRIFEFKVERTPSFESKQATLLFRMLSENYGHAGEAYIRYIVTHQDEVRTLIDAAVLYLQHIEKTLPEERMRVAVVAAVMVGLKIMKHLGLIRFDEKRVHRWAMKQIIAMRALDHAYQIAPLDLLGQYINETTPQRIVVNSVIKGSDGKKKFIILRYPTNGMLSRFDVTEAKLWIDQRHFRSWCVERQEDPETLMIYYIHTKVMQEMARKSLGEGGEIATSSIKTMVIDMSHPELGNVRQVMIESEKAATPPTEEAA